MYPQELRIRVRALIRPTLGIVEGTADRGLRATTDPMVRRGILVWKIETTTTFLSAMLRSDPALALPDVLAKSGGRGTFAALGSLNDTTADVMTRMNLYTMYLVPPAARALGGRARPGRARASGYARGRAGGANYRDPGSATGAPGRSRRGSTGEKRDVGGGRGDREAARGPLERTVAHRGAQRPGRARLSRRGDAAAADEGRRDDPERRRGPRDLRGVELLLIAMVARPAVEAAGRALADQIRTETFDEEAIRARAAAVADAALLRDIRAVLTTEQREKLDRLLVPPPPPRLAGASQGDRLAERRYTLLRVPRKEGVMGTTTRPASPFRWARAQHAEGMEGRLLRALAARVGPAAIGFSLGPASVRASADPPVATVRFRDRRTLLALALDPVGRFGDAYAEGRIEIEGDLVAALKSVFRALESKTRPSFFRRLGTYVPHTLPRDHRNVHHHYDLGNDFYRLWLDERLLYTCAYFESPEQSLEDAQVAKMEYVCRKLGLRSGETVVEAGCGWGALALHMARCHGVRVRAYNVSTEQIAWARRQAEREGLTGQVEFLEEDYRRIDGRCDAFVSVGMLEHVGLANYREMARVLARTLDRKHGRGLLHFIGRDRPQPLDPWIRRRIFPGAYAPTLEESFRGVLVPARMSVVDVENLRPHYALTLRHWRERYERAVAENRVTFDERFRRTWKLYLAGSEAAFRTGSLQLFQVAFAPAESNAVPWTREALYRSAEGLSWNEPTS